MASSCLFCEQSIPLVPTPTPSPLPSLQSLQSSSITYLSFLPLLSNYISILPPSPYLATWKCLSKRVMERRRNGIEEVRSWDREEQEEKEQEQGQEEEEKWQRLGRM